MRIIRTSHGSCENMAIFFFLYRLTWLLYQGALLDIRHTNNQEESETQGQQAQRGNKQKVFSLEERRLRENMMVEVK